MRVNFNLIVLLIIAIAINLSPVRSFQGMEFFRISVQTVFYPLTYTSNALAASTSGFFLNIGRLYKAQQENQDLIKRLKAAEAKINIIEGLAAENVNLREILKFKRSSYNQRLLPAEVIERSEDLWDSFIVIDKGSKDGVGEDMTVISSGWLAGKVVLVAHDRSTIQLITNAKTRVSGYIPRVGVHCVVEGGHGRDLYVKYIPAGEDLEIGDEVSVSSYSDQYKKNISIGRISDIQKREEDMFQGVKIRPGTDFSRINWVFVAEE